VFGQLHFSILWVNHPSFMAKHLLVLFCLLQRLQELMFVYAALSGHKYFHHAPIPALLLNIPGFLL